MRSTLLLVLLLTLASCGGGSGGSKTNASITRDQLGEARQVELDCLDKELNWISDPPANKTQVLESMARSKFETCRAREEVLDLYINRVMEAHQQLNF